VKSQSNADCKRVEVKDTLTVAECAEHLGICEALVYALIREGKLPAVRLGMRRLAVPRKALDSLLAGTWPPSQGGVR
jgi:excisionase family DNA binding protein